jgi:hypothetical protein
LLLSLKHRIPLSYLIIAQTQPPSQGTALTRLI